MIEDHETSERDNLFVLASDYFDQTASEKEMAQLEHMLTQNPQAQSEYLRFAMLHGMLGLTAKAKVDTTCESSDHNIINHISTTPTAILSSRDMVLGSLLVMCVFTMVALTISTMLHRTEDTTTPSISYSDIPLHEGVTSELPGYYDNRELPRTIVANLISSTTSAETVRHAQREQQPISARTIKPGELEAHLTSLNGADVLVQGLGMFGFMNEQAGILYRGSVKARVAAPGTQFSVLTSQLRIVDLGTEFRVSLVDDDRVQVQVMDGMVEVQSRVRLPICFWNFDSSIDQTNPQQLVDLMHQFPLRLGQSTKRTTGIVGTGSLTFDNTPLSYCLVEGGTSPTTGSGIISGHSGISIEAMFISTWNGQLGDYDEIFRKEDGSSRMLLSFQNDLMTYDVPDVEPGPCLSFGLHLEELGYSELDMPLDGLEGRPSLAELTDGKPHHVVATYDSFTGMKSISIDGELRFEHRFPEGAMVISGGPAPAQIGNHSGSEPFSGTIDEVALYDFALTPHEIAQHYQRAMAGQCYFGEQTSLPAQQWKLVTRLSQGQSGIFNQATGLAE
jgi:hypothetical protein